MTRKCIMCKGKNYKNACSFFSAPKDPETRFLWQKAINIKDYTVNDDTYVCSKHFRKDDIITHWVSGVPPQVITIKYKKCRLRRGAVPIPINEKDNLKSEVSSDIPNKSVILDGKKYFIQSKKKEDISKIEDNLNENLNYNLEDEIYEYIPENSQEPEELVNESTSKRQKLNHVNELDKEQIIYSADQNDILYIDCNNLTNIELKQNENDVQVQVDDTEDILTYFPKKSYSKFNHTCLRGSAEPLDGKDLSKLLHCAVSEGNDQIISSPINWQIDSVNEKLEISEITKINELSEEFNKDNFEYTSDSFQEINNCENSSMLFEDFLETYNKVSLPNNWFSSMVSKDHAITIVYSCMELSNSGMPYVQKKVFLNNEMTLRCGISNKEIKLTRFLENGKSFKVSTLSDVEDFIEEFDQMPICSGIADKDSVHKNSFIVMVCDGEIWRHSECCLVLCKGQSLCLKCASITVERKSW